MADVNIDPAQIKAARDAGYSDDEIVGHLSQKYPDQFKAAHDAGYSSNEVLEHFNPAPDPTADVLKGAARGAATFLQPTEGGFAGTVDQGLSLLQHGLIGGVDKGLGLLGYPDAMKYLRDAQAKVDALSAAPEKNKFDIRSVISPPETEGGKIAERAAPMVLSGAAGGAPGVAGFLKSAVAPAVASEAAGKGAEYVGAPEWAPAARLGGAVLGGAFQGSRMKPMDSREISAVEDANYAAFRSHPVEVNPNSTYAWADTVQKGLKKRGLDDMPAYKMLNQYTTPSNPPITPTQLQQTYRDLRAAMETGGEAGEAARTARTGLADYINNLDNRDVLSGGQFLPQMKSDWASARANSLAELRSAAIEGKAYNAWVQNNQAHSGTNINALRQQIGGLLKNKDAMKQSGLEPFREQMEGINEGSRGLNAYRKVSSMMSGPAPFLFPLIIGEHFMGTNGLLAGGAAALGQVVARAAGHKVVEASERNKIDALLNAIQAKGVGLKGPRYIPGSRVPSLIGGINSASP